jgi:hypothetical protein
MAPIAGALVCLFAVVRVVAGAAGARQAGASPPP